MKPRTILRTVEIVAFANRSKHFRAATVRERPTGSRADYVGRSLTVAARKCVNLTRQRYNLIAAVGILAIAAFLGFTARSLGADPEEAVRRKFAEIVRQAEEKRLAAELQDILANLADGVDEEKQIAAFVKLSDWKMPAEEMVAVLTKLLDYQDRKTLRYYAVNRLGYFGPKARPAAEKLFHLFKNSEIYYIRNAAVKSLHEIGYVTPEVVTAYTAYLKLSGVGEEGIWNLLDALGAMGPAAKEAVPAIQKHLKDTDVRTQLKAFHALGKVKAMPEPSLAMLKKMTRIEWNDADGAYPTLTAIQNAGPKADFTVPLLLQALGEDLPTYLRCVMVRTLGHAGASDPQAAKAMFDALGKPLGPNDAGRHDAIIAVNREAVAAVAKLDAKNERIVAVLADRLGDIDPYGRDLAAIHLKRSGPSGKSAVPALAKALKRTDATTNPELVRVLLDACRSIGPGAASCGDVIIDLLIERERFDKNPPKEIDGERNRERNRRDKVNALRVLMKLTLADIGMPQKALPFILDTLANREYRAFAAAARAAGSLGKEAKEAVPLLMRVLDPKFVDQAMHLDTFGTIWVLPEGERTSARIEAIRALAKIGPDAKAALPRLLEMLNDPAPPEGNLPYNEEVRRAVKAIRGGE